MVKKKSKNWKLSAFSLDVETKVKLKEIAEFEGMSKSAMVDFLVNNWDSGVNPFDKFNKLNKKREDLNLKISEIDEELKILNQHMKFFEEWKKQKTNKKETALSIIKRKILDKDFSEAERISKTWQKITGIPAIQLLSEAQIEINTTGI